MRKITVLVVLCILALLLMACCPEGSTWAATYERGGRYDYRTGQGCSCPGKLFWTMTSCEVSKP